MFAPTGRGGGICLDGICLDGIFVAESRRHRAVMRASICKTSGEFVYMTKRSRRTQARESTTPHAANDQKNGKAARRRGRPRVRNQDADTSDRAEALMTAALNLFAERNFASVTIKDIANATGVNTALIYYYFDSKKDLFRRTIEKTVENAFADFDRLDPETDKPDELITQWLDNHLESYDRIHKLVKVSLDYKGAPDGDPAIDEAIRQFYDRERKLLAGCIRAGIEDGMFKQVDADRIAQYISTYLDGAMVRAVILPDFDLPSAVRDLRRTIWDLLCKSDQD